MGLDFLLMVFAEARAEIIGPSLRYLTPDSTLRLICRVVQSTETVAFLFWYHDERMINYDPGINITTEAGELLSLVVRLPKGSSRPWPPRVVFSFADNQYSELTILRAAKKNSGNYSCVPSNSQPANVLVHIFKGKRIDFRKDLFCNSKTPLLSEGTFPE